MYPRATYRLQFNSQFRFNDALHIVEYLQTLGITHVYASPIFKAKPGSPHGYDIIDHNEINPDLGSKEEFESLVKALNAKGMGIILDIVPNHMYAVDISNTWWADVLKNGPNSQYAEYFDIDWLPPRQELAHKVLLPLLDKPYGEALESGDIKVINREGALCIEIPGAVLPTDPKSWGVTVSTIDEIEQFLNQQHYRLCYWRVANDEINYRRFFDVVSLAGIRTERPEVFEAIHRLLFFTGTH